MAKRRAKAEVPKARNRDLLEFVTGMCIVFTATATVVTVIYNLLLLSFIMGILTLMLAMLLIFFGRVG